MLFVRRSLALVLVAALLFVPPAPAQAGLWKSFTNFCSSVAGGVVNALTSAADLVAEAGCLVANGILVPVNLVCGTDMTISYKDPKTGKTTKKKVDPQTLAKLQSCHVIAGSFEIAGKTYGDEKVFHFKIDQPGEVDCSVSWTGAPALAMILNGPGQVGYYDRIDGSSPLSFRFTVTPELVKKGTEWRISLKDFTKSGKPSKGTLTAFTPRRLGETLSAATTEQRAGYAEQDIRKLVTRIERLETDLRLEKEFSRRLLDLIKELRTRINAIDHKDDARGGRG